MEYELGITGYLIAYLLCALDKKIAGAKDFVYPDSLSCTRPFVHLALDRDVAVKVGVTFFFPKSLQFFLTRFLGVGGNDSYIPAMLFFHVHVWGFMDERFSLKYASEGRPQPRGLYGRRIQMVQKIVCLRHRQVMITCRTCPEKKVLFQGFCPLFKHFSVWNRLFSGKKNSSSLQRYIILLNWSYILQTIYSSDGFPAWNVILRFSTFYALFVYSLL